MAAHNTFSRAVAADEAAIGDNLCALESRLVDREGEASSGALQVSTHRDMFIRIGRWALVGGGLFACRGVENALWQFVYDNWGTIVPLANSYGAGFGQWFMGNMTKVSDFAGMAAHVEVRPVLRTREPK